MRSTVKVDPTLGTAIRHARTERRMSQEALAFAADLSVSSLARIERSETAASWRSAESIAWALGVPLKRLVPSRPPLPRRERPASLGADGALAVTVRRLREERGLSQQGLAHEAYLALETVARLERGGTLPHMSTMQGVADALEISLHELIEAIEQTRASEQAHPLPAPGGGE